MTNSLNQLNISFDPLEDRLLLRMTSGTKDALTEYRLWLTRRLVKLLWPVLNKMLETDTTLLSRVSGDNRKAVLEFQQEAALSKADFATPYTKEEKQTPLGPKPLLVSRIQAGKGQDGRQILSLKTADNQGINISLTPHTIHSIKKLLVNSIKKAGWDLTPPAPDAVQKPESQKLI